MSGCQQGCRGCQGELGWQVDWEPYHIGPQFRVPALPLAGSRGHQGTSRGCRGIRSALGLAGV